ncbi:MAG TPA: alkaline phosphatase family protein, partial [Opitutaceae bacterium]|nr:alkaline phosphatase family protein [Opitutaceae bacterium]
LAHWSEANFEAMDSRNRSLHEKGFVTNSARQDYRELSTLKYVDAGKEREMVVPKGDVLHQFREDVQTGNLPAVSWLVPPERFSDHPSNPWYGALYLSETLDILTQNPEVWRKTIFILCYDENDGYFDHVPPFVPPRTDRTDTGAASAGIDTSSEHVLEDPAKDPYDDGPGKAGRDGPIGLGFRVPMVVASPWSRGGYVCSEVFDHTSVLRFLEEFASAKSGRAVRESNISDWRRTICGDLSSVFRPFQSTGPSLPRPLVRETYLPEINQAQFRPVPSDFRSLPATEMASLAGKWPARQEPGVKPACALPYDLEVDGSLGAEGIFGISFSAGNERFGRRSVGAPFHVYSPAPVRRAGQGGEPREPGRTWSYAVAAGGRVEGKWRVEDFESGTYHLRVHGPNGFYREFRGTSGNGNVAVRMRTGATREPSCEIELKKIDGGPITVVVEDAAYGAAPRRVPLGAGAVSLVLPIGLSASSGWYDLRMSIEGHADYITRYAGRIETGAESTSDPQMGSAS